jgi:serine phosphatase RsbU (regulator of sigma subunit)
MGRDTLEELHAGVIYLYGAFSRKEFYENLEMFLAGVFPRLKFSVLVPGDRAGRLYLDYSNALPIGAAQTAVRSPDLESVLQGRRDREYAPDERPMLSAAGAEQPIHSLRMIAREPGSLAVMALHDALPAAGESGPFGLESFIFDHISMAFQKMRERDEMRQALEKSRSRLEAIRCIGTLLGTLDLEVLLSKLIEVCIFLTGAQVGSIQLRGPVAADVEWGLPSTVLDELKFRDGKSITSSVAARRQAELITDYSQDPRCEPLLLFSVDSFLCVPLVSKDRALGTINLVNSDRDGKQLSETDLLSISTISSLAATAIDNAILHRESLEKQQIEANLKIAQSIQQGMYPTRQLEVAGYDLAWLNKSCDETGGDYFDFVGLPGGRLAIAIGDVSGHGIGAALLMATGRANLRALLSVKDELREVMERLNALLENDMDTAKFMTLFVARLDPSTSSLAYVNAGHDPPLLYRAATGSVAELEASGIPLGMFPEYAYGLVEVAKLEPGDVLLLTTDGVWEAVNRSRQRYGKERLREFLEGHARLDAEGLLARLHSAVQDFCEGVPPSDDKTMIVVKRRAD